MTLIGVYRISKCAPILRFLPVKHCFFESIKKVFVFLKKGLDKKALTWYNTNVPKRFGSIATVRWCGSMAEQLICNQQVDGSTPFTSSKKSTHMWTSYGRFPEWPKGADCKSVASSLRWSESTISHQQKRTFVDRQKCVF